MGEEARYDRHLKEVLLVAIEEFQMNFNRAVGVRPLVNK